MNKNSLYGTTTMTPAERAAGRFMRAPDHPVGGGQAPAAGGTPPQDTNNGGAPSQGNSEPTTNTNTDSNNDGQSFDANAFWNGPAPAEGAASSGESAGNPGGESGNDGGEGGDFAQQLTQRLEGLTFGDPVFNDEIAGQINEGNYEGVQERLNTMSKAVVREALAMQVQILRPFAEQLMNQVREETQQTFQSRDNNESLERLFPAAKNPAMAKTIGPIYEQALKNTNNDREAAVKQTKEMLRFMAGQTAGDLDLEVAPKGEGSRGSPTQNYNWLDELTGRK